MKSPEYRIFPQIYLKKESSYKEGENKIIKLHGYRLKVKVVSVTAVDKDDPILNDLLAQMPEGSYKPDVYKDFVKVFYRYQCNAPGANHLEAMLNLNRQ